MRASITRSELQNMAANAKVYQLGRKLAESGAADSTVYVPEEQTFLALITEAAASPELCSVSVRENGRPLNFQCTCTDSKKYWGFCRHAIALLLTASQKGSNPPNIDVSEIARYGQEYHKQKLLRGKLSPSESDASLPKTIVNRPEGKPLPLANSPLSHTSSSFSPTSSADRSTTSALPTDWNRGGDPSPARPAAYLQFLERIQRRKIAQITREAEWDPRITGDCSLHLHLPKTQSTDASAWPRLELRLLLPPPLDKGTPAIDWLTWIAARQQGLPYSLSSELTWDSTRDRLPLPLEQFLDILVDNQSLLREIRHHLPDLTPQQLPLPPMIFDHFLTAIRDWEPHSLTYSGRRATRPFRVIEDWPRLTIQIQKQGEGFSLLTEGENPVSRYPGLHAFCRQGEHFYRIPSDCLSLLPLLDPQLHLGQVPLILPIETLGRILTLLEPLKKRGYLKVDPDLLLPAPAPRPEIWIDRLGHRWTLQIAYSYGQGMRVYPLPTALHALGRGGQPKFDPTLSACCWGLSGHTPSPRDLIWETQWNQRFARLGLQTQWLTLTTPGAREGNEYYQLQLNEWVEAPVQYQLTGETALRDLLTEILPALPDPSCLHLREGVTLPRVQPLQISSPTLGEEKNLSSLSLLQDLPISEGEWRAILRARAENQTVLRLSNGDLLDWQESEDRLAQIEELLAWGASWQDNQLTLSGARVLAWPHLDSILNPDHPLRVLRNQLFQSTLPTDRLDTVENLPPLRPYQRQGVAWLSLLADAGLGGVLADDMGLGKTLQALSFLHVRRKAKIDPPSPQIDLIIAPTALLYNWRAEAQRFTPDLHPMVVRGTPEQRERWYQEISSRKRDTLLILSYAQVRQDLHHLQKLPLQTVILDEAQAIKNHRTQTAQAIQRLKSPLRFALTGTPIENNLGELWSLIDFVLPGYLLRYREFRRIYEHPIRAGEEAPLERLRAWLRPFVLRRLKTEVLTDLPPKIETVYSCEMTQEQRSLYQQLLLQTRDTVRAWQEESQQSNGISQPHPAQQLAQNRIRFLTLLTRLRQVCCHPRLLDTESCLGSGKFDVLHQLLDQAKSGGHRVLVFSQFTKLLRLAETELQSAGYSTLYLDGQLQAQERQKRVTQFNLGETDVFLISLRAGGTGLNLTTADTVILLDPWWNPAVETQAMDRAHRIGQKHTVQVYRLIAANSVEERIQKLQTQKQELIQGVMAPGSEEMLHLTPEEWLHLLEPDPLEEGQESW